MFHRYFIYSDINLVCSNIQTQCFTRHERVKNQYMLGNVTYRTHDFTSEETQNGFDSKFHATICKETFLQDFLVILKQMLQNY